MKCPWLSIKPGNRELAAQIDHLRRRPDVLLDALVGADRRDPIAANGDRLRFGHRRIDGDDLAVAKHKGRGRLRSLGNDNRGQDEEREDVFHGVANDTSTPRPNRATVSVWAECPG